jgi:hypothetical protein
MRKEMQIEAITYERERLDFFTELMKLAQTRYNLLHRRFKDAPYLSEAHQTLSDMGREIQFFGDVVEMLEKGYRKQSEGEWVLTGTFNSIFPLPVADLHISCSVCGWKPPKYSDDYKEYNFCPNCGARMKGGE